MRAAISHGIIARRRLLSSLSSGQRMELLEELFTDLFGTQHVTLQKWAALTGQSAQVDAGYIAQFIATIVLGEPGQGFRGKGDDLVDGSEVKSATNISGVDTPRWNHNLGTPADDSKRRAEGRETGSEQYLSSPHLFYLLVDRPPTRQEEPEGPVPFRIRAWCIDAQADEDWRDLVMRYTAGRGSSRYNLQLHSPVGRDDNLVVNTMGNLDFTDVLLFEARLSLRDRARPTVVWPKGLPRSFLPVRGRTRAEPYQRLKRSRSSTSAADLVADASVVADLFPGLSEEQVADLGDVAAAELRLVEELAEDPDDA